MTSSQAKVEQFTTDLSHKKLHESAKQHARKLVDDFAVTLVVQAKVIATRDRDELVLKRHVDEAFEFILLQKRKNWMREFLKIMGGAFVGAFIPGLIASLPANDITGSIIFIVLGFIGLTCIFIGLLI
jgi:hypothetical protein